MKHILVGGKAGEILNKVQHSFSRLLDYMRCVTGDIWSKPRLGVVYVRRTPRLCF